MADPRFIGLVQSILSSGRAALGDINPLTQRLARDGALAQRTARRSLELLLMLEHKTLGNLDESERENLTRARRELEEALAAERPPSG